MVNEIAGATDRSPQTIRWLVKRALAKTWCRRQAVAASLAEGKTVADIARATNRKPESVCQLVKQALSKTWCSRQAELVRVVLSTSRLPVPAPKGAIGY